jgi:hypothetical protein
MPTGRIVSLLGIPWEQTSLLRAQRSVMLVKLFNLIRLFVRNGFKMVHYTQVLKIPEPRGQ